MRFTCAGLECVSIDRGLCPEVASMAALAGEKWVNFFLSTRYRESDPSWVHSFCVLRFLEYSSFGDHVFPDHLLGDHKLNLLRS